LAAVCARAAIGGEAVFALGRGRDATGAGFRTPADES
jgi:hypothetical protein